MALCQIARLLLSGCALCIPWDTQEPIHKMFQRLKLKKFIMAFWDVLFEDEHIFFSVSSNDWVVTFGAALVLPIVLKLCSNKAQFISMLILVGINFIIH